MRTNLIPRTRAVAWLALSARAFFTVIADDAPGWLKQAAAGSVPTYEKDVPGVVLFDEQQTIGRERQQGCHHRELCRPAADPRGRGLAIARAYYLVSSGKIKEIKAWIITA